MVKYTDDYWKEVKHVLTCVPGVNSLSGKSILVTGATGMICSTVVELLFWLNKESEANINIVLAGRDRKRIQQRFYILQQVM